MWKIPALDVRDSVPNDSDTDIVVLFQNSDGKMISPKGVYASLVEKLKKDDLFFGKHGACQFVRYGGQGRVRNCLVVGMGTLGDLTEERVRSAGGILWSKLVAEKSKKANLRVEFMPDNEMFTPDLSKTRFVHCLLEGMLLGCYQFNKYKSGSSAAPKPGGSKQEAFALEKITLLISDKRLKPHWAPILKQIIALVECIKVTRDWSNEPSNFGTPEYFASEAKRLGSQFGLKCKILSEADAAKEKMGLFLAVGQGAERESKLVILEYIPKGGKNSKTVALVGKGVTFDSGGISIKPSLRMEEMKHDMTGASTVMGAVLLAARLRVPNRVVAIMAFVENMPDGKAMQPGNVIRSRSGKTVEVINTDAEGRLILADALDYAQDYKPDVVIDVATLTGAVSVALGKYCCGVMGNDEALLKKLQDAGKFHGERIWQLPMFEEYFEDLKSETADLKNSANDSNGGTIRGAMFLKQFIKKDVKWAHLDIAATAWGLSHLTYFPKKGASGAYVRTLSQFAADFR